jgi:hypothetical protein
LDHVSGSAPQLPALFTSAVNSGKDSPAVGFTPSGDESKGDFSIVIKKPDVQQFSTTKVRQLLLLLSFTMLGDSFFLNCHLAMYLINFKLSMLY